MVAGRGQFRKPRLLIEQSLGEVGPLNRCVGRKLRTVDDRIVEHGDGGTGSKVCPAEIAADNGGIAEVDAVGRHDARASGKIDVVEKRSGKIRPIERRA